ncbi:hypothetical protein Aab01nite_54640 [Paractinoplanes abujensis]|uniref:Deazaflavin-dependent oxidoreductase (Nitroreductase family) n=1 Tax=Paractinoplanes abujensis TaxID=882441 RepID=A0A7W7CUD7_9ACTN|nr:nitroreductase/quinone reductase family protein [Actinoplanes abujensis]MBB4693468.1 hypothetical protein [Actinoplanes abujensis]GID21874.1 hypothetical protein Aab01nite_54640 [Actinoplanes abujensis]
MLIVSPLKRWMYRGGRPHALARLLNRISAAQYRAGFLAPRTWVTLEVPGRRTGRTVSCPLVVVRHQDSEYLVSMLGNDANWVANVRAAGGEAVLSHGRRERIRLSEVAVEQRPPILRLYLSKAPGARPHIPVDRRAPIAAFAAVAADYPVFLVTRLGSPVP